MENKKTYAVREGGEMEKKSLSNTWARGNAGALPRQKWLDGQQGKGCAPGPQSQVGVAPEIHCVGDRYQGERKETTVPCAPGRRLKHLTNVS